MRYMRWIIITTLFSFGWLLSGCGPMTIKDTTTQSYIPIQGWVLVLQRDVVISPGRARVFFQGGRLLSAVNEYEPHCQLMVRDISEQPQTVHAGRFTIDRVFGNSGEIVHSDYIRLASAGATVIADGGGDGDADGRLIYFYFLGLHADEQPNVTYLVCGGALEMAAFARYPTLQDIQAALGDYATLILPEEG
jgi:hypothetical protein